MSFKAQSITRAVEVCLDAESSSTRVWVACSGGLDSMVMLHAVAQHLRGTGRLGVIHVNHGLAAEAAEWAVHIQVVCEKLGLRYELREIVVEASPWRGLEDAARRARYQAFGEVLGADDILLTAHHQDDQAETVLLQLFRGSGPLGLAGMPLRRSLAAGWLLRPFLKLSRVDLEAYAVFHKVQWSEDPSNGELRFRRNRLRHEVVPLIEKTWPRVSASLARAASTQVEVSEISAALGAIDLAPLVDVSHHSVAVDGLLALSPARAKNALRAWVNEWGGGSPTRAQTERLLCKVSAVRSDRELLLPLGGATVRRYRGRLYILRPSAMSSIEVTDAPECIPWDPRQPLTLASGALTARLCRAAGLDNHMIGCGGLSVRCRKGGERIRPAGRKVTKRVKALFQEAGVPPWRRTGYPLVYIKEQLVAIPGICVADGWVASADRLGWMLEWKPMDG